jgi:hypothetical protein
LLAATRRDYERRSFRPRFPYWLQATPSEILIVA